MKYNFEKLIFIAIIIAAILTSISGCSNTNSAAQSTASTLVSTSADTTNGTGTQDMQKDASNQPPNGTPPNGTLPDGAPGGEPGDGGPGGGAPGGSGTVDHGSYAALVTKDASGVIYNSTGDSENAVRVEGKNVTLSDVTINKTSGAAGSGDSSNFYGANAGLLAMDGATVTLNNPIVKTTVEGGNGIFSYGEGTKVIVNNAKISTSGDSAGGIMVTGGGTMNVNDSIIETQGDHSAALRTDRGGGTLTVDGGSYTSNGTGSPAIYSTAAISVSNAALNTTNSEALVIEGKNSITLANCDVIGNMTSTNSENTHNVMIYQSMSGDADTGMSALAMTNGSLAGKKGDMIYVTNTSCTINLTNVKLAMANDVLLRIAGNSSNNWGKEGSNGGKCVFTANNQVLTDKIIVDKISSLQLLLTNKSTFTGTINNQKEGGSVTVNLDANSKWVLSGDSYITELKGSTANIDTNGHKLYVNGTAFK